MEVCESSPVPNNSSFSSFILFRTPGLPIPTSTQTHWRGRGRGARSPPPAPQSQDCAIDPRREPGVAPSRQRSETLGNGPDFPAAVGKSQRAQTKPAVPGAALSGSGRLHGRMAPPAGRKLRMAAESLSQQKRAFAYSFQKDPRQDFLLWSFELRIRFSFAERGRWRKGKPRPAGLPQEDTPSWTRVRRSPLAPQSQNCAACHAVGDRSPHSLPESGAIPSSQYTGVTAPNPNQRKDSIPQSFPRGHLWFKCFMCLNCFFFLQTGSPSVT